MSRTEPGVVDLVEIIPSYVDEVILRTVQDTHRAVSARAYGAVNAATGNAATGPQRVHEVVSETVFAAVRVGVVGGVTIAGALSGLMGHRGLTGPRSSVVHSALNGLLGDRFSHDASVLSIALSVRTDGQDVALTDLADSFPEPTGKLVVFIHGLGEHDGHWSRGAAERGSTYPQALTRAGWTPVVLRVNTGLSLAENGTALAGLLAELSDAWPTPVERIALVGHSMGGLLARAACAVGSTTGEGWRGLVTDVVTLGTPHLGADLARVVGLGSRSLARFPETAAFGRLLDVRSAGIVELSGGLGLEEPHDVRYRLVSGSLPGAWGTIFGDAMVRRGSATGRSARANLFPDAEVLHLEGVGHLDLLNHAEVEAALLRWLE
ncbi:putative PGAP1 family protein [metagenome]|uniref:Putative PGAP1 family protein n=1 Tax=metagenome TaxID=256318 RepID=A0A2P2C898_9ZZZZ